MEWKSLKDNFPTYGDNVKILTTDGKDVYVMYEDHNELWFISETYENEGIISDRLTHWAFLKDVPLPNKSKGE